MSDSPPAGAKRPDPKDGSRPKRRRRSPESARRAILDAAGRRLTEDGPDGLRLQSIAADLGIAHSSILHHFGSREGLLEALSTDAFDALDRDLRATLESAVEGSGRRSSDLLERVARTLRDQGHARLLAWQIMSGRLPREDDAGETDASDRMLARITEVVHRVRVDHAREHALPTPEDEDTRFFVLLIAYALFGEALAGESFGASAGFDGSEDAHAGFMRWLGERSEKMILPAPGSASNRPDADEGKPGA